MQYSSVSVVLHVLLMVLQTSAFMGNDITLVTTVTYSKLITLSACTALCTCVCVCVYYYNCLATKVFVGNVLVTEYVCLYSHLATNNYYCNVFLGRLPATKWVWVIVK